jgi:hypothetical protein
MHTIIPIIEIKVPKAHTASLKTLQAKLNQATDDLKKALHPATNIAFNFRDDSAIQPNSFTITVNFNLGEDQYETDFYIAVKKNECNIVSGAKYKAYNLKADDNREQLIAKLYTALYKKLAILVFNQTKASELKVGATCDKPKKLEDSPWSMRRTASGVQALDLSTELGTFTLGIDRNKLELRRARIQELHKAKPKS